MSQREAIPQACKKTQDGMEGQTSEEDSSQKVESSASGLDSAAKGLWPEGTFVRRFEEARKPKSTVGSMSVMSHVPVMGAGVHDT